MLDERGLKFSINITKQQPKEKPFYSTVTDFAKFLGQSTSNPFFIAIK